MKKILLVLLAQVSLLLAPASALDAGATGTRDEKTALEEFKKDVARLKTRSEEQEQVRAKAGQSDPDAEQKELHELVGMLKAIKTSGLPADLKSTWQAIVRDVGELGTIMAVMSADLPNGANDPLLAENMADVQKKFEDLMNRLDADGKKVAAAAKKYGIEGLDKVIGSK